MVMAKRKTVTLKRLDVMSVAKIYAVIMAVCGLIYGIILAVVGAMLGSLAGSAAMATGFGLISIIGTPIMFGIIGFVAGAVGAFLYNVVAKRVGGIKLEVD